MGYYVNNEYDEQELRDNQPDTPLIDRCAGHSTCGFEHCVCIMCVFVSCGTTSLPLIDRCACTVYSVCV